MPCGYGGSRGNVPRRSSRGGFTPSNRPVRPIERNEPGSGVKERVGPLPILWNTDPRCIILTFATLEIDSWKFVEPFSLLIQESHLKTPLDSEAQVNKDSLESVCPPLPIILPVDLPKEQKLDSSKDSKQPVFAKLDNSSEADALGQSRDRSTPIESMKNSSKASLAKPLVSNNSSAPECNSSSLLDTDFLVSNTPKVDKPGRRSSRKKRKKKGKQNRKSTWKKNPGEGVRCQESSSSASVSEIAISSDSTICEDNLQCNITEKLIDHAWPAHDTAKKGKKKVGNSDHTHSSSPPLSRAPFGSERCEPIFSSSQMSSDEEVSTNQTDTDAGSIFLSANSSFSPAPEATQSSSDESITNAYASDVSCSTSYDEYNAPVVTSFVDNWKIGVRTNGIETTASFKDNQGHNLSGGTIILDTRGNGTSCCSISEVSGNKKSEISANCYNYWSKDVDTGSNTEITHCSSQSPSSNGFQIVVNRKRDRLIKKLSQGLNGTGRFDMVHDQTGKESNHSTCQRGQKNGSERISEVNKKPNTNSLYAKGSEVQGRFDPLFGLKHNVSGNFLAHTSELTSPISRIKASSKGVKEFKIPSRTIDLKQSDNSKTKPTSSLKQGNNHLNKVSQTEKNSHRPLMIHVQQNGDISPQPNHQKFVGVGANSYSNVCQNIVVIPSIKVDYCQSEPHHNAAENRTSTSQMGSNSVEEKQVEDQSNSDKEMPDDRFFTNREDCRNVTNSDSNISHTDHNKVNDGCIPVLHKWDSLSEKDSSTSSTNRTDTLTDTTVGDSVIDSLNPKNAVESLGSSSHCSLQMNDGMSCLTPCLREVTAPSLEADELTTHYPCTCGDKGKMLHIAISSLSHKVKIKPTSNIETDLDMIVEAVNESYKSWNISESVRITTGSPIAEFEMFLHSASPVLDKRYCSGSSGSCTSDQLSSETLCQCQIPNIPLKCFWEWYERPSCYGMEVIAQDYLNSRRSHNGQFSAYFVPYLSAIQLFGCSRSSVHQNNPSEVMVKACEVAARDEFHNKSVRSTQSVDGEVLFEYFESERPQLRRPLFEKIKELVRTGTSSDGKMYGDRLKLECVNLHELHPASWFSVAWYPIYRIPDGNFRAAFITYHSLGHFVRTIYNTSDGVDHIISPGVGLQSYNAKGECWFVPRGSASNVFQQEAAMSLDPSQVVKERLAKLEKTASVMARASVSKDSVRSVNKQPDYEFFLSRSR